MCDNRTRNKILAREKKPDGWKILIGSGTCMSRFVPVKIVRRQDLQTPDGRVRYRLDFNQLQIIHSMSKSHAFIRNAIHHLRGALLGGGILIYREGEEENVSLEPHVQHLVQTEWVAFCKELLRDLMTYGMAFVVLDLKKKTPKTLDPATDFKEIHISQDIFGCDRRYEVSFEDLANPIDLTAATNRKRGGAAGAYRNAPPMFVVEQDAPTREGDLTSLCRVILADDAFVNTMKQCTVAAAQRSSRPPLITSTSHKTPESKAVVRDTAAIGDSTLGAAEAQAFQHRNHAEVLLSDVEQIRLANVSLEENADSQMSAMIDAKNQGEGWLQLVRAKRSYGLAASGNSMVVVDPATGAVTYPEVVGAKQYMSAFINLPPDTKLESPPTATAPGQIAEIMELYRDVVAGVMGVPSVLWGSTRSSVAANQTVLNTFNDTKQWYRVILQTVIQQLFGVMFRDRIDEQNNAELRQMISRLTEGEKIEAARKKHQSKTDADQNIKVALPGMFDLEIIEKLQAIGLAPMETLTSMASAYLGVPKEMMAEEKLDPATGRPLEEVQKETQEHEEHMMEKQSKLKIAENSAKIPSSKKPLSGQPAKKKPRTK